MREIKFRAWSELKRRWVYYGTAAHGTVDYLMLKMDTEGQFTGLKDKNGTDVFEGDIIRHERYQPSDGSGTGKSNLLWAVEWTTETYSGNPQWHPMNSQYGCYQEYYGDWDPCEFEVIGNIYENPGLLENGE